MYGIKTKINTIISCYYLFYFLWDINRLLIQFKIIRQFKLVWTLSGFRPRFHRIFVLLFVSPVTHVHYRWDKQKYIYMTNRANLSNILILNSGSLSFGLSQQFDYNLRVYNIIFLKCFIDIRLLFAPCIIVLFLTNW